MKYIITIKKKKLDPGKAQAPLGPYLGPVLLVCHETRTRCKKENHLLEKKKSNERSRHCQFSSYYRVPNNFSLKRSDQMRLTCNTCFLMTSQPFWSCESQVL